MRERERKSLCNGKLKKLTILGLVEEEAKDDGLGAHGRV